MMSAANKFGRGHNAGTAVLLFIAPLFLFAACDESGSACKRPGDEWCRGNTMVACLDHSIDDFVNRKPIFEEGIECGDYGAECVEWDELNEWDSESGPHKAGCAALGQDCDNVGEAVCADDRVIWYCEPAMRYVMYGCLGNYCVYDADGQAVCAYHQDACIDGSSMCDPDDETRYFMCSNGAWYFLGVCDEGETCVQTSLSEVECSPLTLW